MKTRRRLRLWATALAALVVLCAPRAISQGAVEQWSVFDIAFDGPAAGNPFVDVTLDATFVHDGVSRVVPGFYDGNGTYRVRFMPDAIGRWTYRTTSTAQTLDGKSGVFTVAPASPGNHGPVRVAHTFHFAYADGTPYRPIGTTVYAWLHQPDALQEQTLQSLATSPFNKLRFTLFPKRYTWNANEPPMYAFEGTPGHFDLARFNPLFFRHVDQRIFALQRLGIEADTILFHPYDDGAWGFDRMAAQEDDRYVRYVIARFGAFRNIWWSLANEYDFMIRKTERDWERIGRLVSARDPFHHLISIHNGRQIFNQTRPWITHASLQNGSAVEDPNTAGIYRDSYRKPIVYDEVKYEGDLPKRWGNLSAEELVFRFWNATVAGTYATHGETFLSPDDVIWWAKGGALKGQSPPRLAFLKAVLADGPADGIEPIDKWQHAEYGGQPSRYYLVYLGKQSPTSWTFRLPKPPSGADTSPAEGMSFTVEVLDTWQMTVTPVPGTFTLKKQDDYFYADAAHRSVSLPGRPYVAIRIRRVTS